MVFRMNNLALCNNVKAAIDDRCLRVRVPATGCPRSNRKLRDLNTMVIEQSAASMASILVEFPISCHRFVPPLFLPITLRHCVWLTVFRLFALIGDRTQLKKKASGKKKNVGENGEKSKEMNACNYPS